MPGVRVSVAPPALRHEVVPMAPSPRHQWIAGYWGWRGGAHLWIGGHWALPPAPGYAGSPLAGKTRKEPTCSTMVTGGRPSRWIRRSLSTAAAPMTQVVTEVEPPPPIVEVRPGHGRSRMPFGCQGTGTGTATGTFGSGDVGSAHPEGHGWEAHHWDHRSDGRWVQQPGHWHPEERRAEGPQRR